MSSRLTPSPQARPALSLRPGAGGAGAPSRGSTVGGPRARQTGSTDFAGALPPAAADLLRLWITARDAAPVAHRVLLPELALLTALEGSVAEACSALREVAEAEGGIDTVAAVDLLRGSLATEPHADDAERFLDAWDAAASCPMGRGVFPLAALRPDLPLQRAYRALVPSSRVVFLSLAHEAGHGRVLADAAALGGRTGLSVAEVRLAVGDLVARRWLARHPDLAPRVFSVTPAAFLSVADGRWATRRGRPAPRAAR
jgi:hypothetical protein